MSSGENNRNFKRLYDEWGKSLKNEQKKLELPEYLDIFKHAIQIPSAIEIVADWVISLRRHAQIPAPERRRVSQESEEILRYWLCLIIDSLQKSLMDFGVQIPEFHSSFSLQRTSNVRKTIVLKIQLPAKFNDQLSQIKQYIREYLLYQTIQASKQSEISFDLQFNTVQ